MGCRRWGGLACFQCSGAIRNLVLLNAVLEARGQTFKNGYLHIWQGSTGRGRWASCHERAFAPIKRAESLVECSGFLVVVSRL
ncbi:uncharacterized protein K460DRAFT_55619 [Cucurbitaria berberidis CBS 394.84]|uniref:Secreted protein n=1 Tax=Cucurbitaria berberidis CBS 394.84 TaxID=1168544 RepID=A0A9P4GL69_9PLEO|nr:uncharacterized protein K460DRAFT_55619 [Cucurbitaria berberidis CBS 394.84]KAF1847224.1 hypothetical protein K460DRAFT_55619 [Cucurbitaria berberidis CBS 394.84]